MNKGEELAICLRHTSEGYPFNDNNAIMFTTGHELAHVMSLSIGHNKEFMDNFRFLLKESKKANV